MARSVETPWNPATTATFPPSSASRRRSPRISRILALRWAVSVTMPACEPVNDTAASPQVDDRHAEQRDRDALTRGEEHVHLAGASGSLDTSWARRSRSSVVLPMAETTTTTSSPARRVRTMCSATARMRSGSATDVPPNFCTSRLTTSHGTGEAAPILGPDFAVGRLPRRAQGHQTRTPAPEPRRPSRGDAGGGEAAASGCAPPATSRSCSSRSSSCS